jgi:hypothetical protein
VRTLNPSSGRPPPGTPKPTSATARSQSKQREPLLTPETTRAVRPTIKALLDGDRPMALPTPRACHSTHGNSSSAPKAPGPLG